MLSPDLGATDELGNELTIERWIAKKSLADGILLHTYIEFDSRMRGFMHAHSSRWQTMEQQLEDLDPEFFVSAVSYCEGNDSVVEYVRNEDQLGRALEINLGSPAGGCGASCGCTLF